MLNCRDVTEHANLNLIGELGWWRKAQLVLHLFMCRHCRRYVDQMTATVQLLRNKPPEPPAAKIERTLLEIFRQLQKDK